MAVEYWNNSVLCQEIQNASRNVTPVIGIQPVIERKVALGIMLLTGLMTCFMAWLFLFVRKHVYKNQHDSSQGEEVWESARDIDNPLSLWVEKYQKELQLSHHNKLHDKPTLPEVRVFKIAFVLAYSLSSLICIIILVIWPLIIASFGVMTVGKFVGWQSSSTSCLVTNGDHTALDSGTAAHSAVDGAFKNEVIYENAEKDVHIIDGKKTLGMLKYKSSVISSTVDPF